MQLWGKDDAGKVKLFFIAFSLCPNSIFLASVLCWNFYTWNLAFKKGSINPGCLSKIMLSKGSGTMAERGWSQFPQVISKSLWLIPNTQVGQTPPGSLGVCCWIPQRHKHTLVHGLMPIFFFQGMIAHEWGMVYSVTMLTLLDLPDVCF